MKSIEFSKEEIVELKKIVGLNVKRLRMQRKLSQMELYEAIGHKSNTIISQGELGRKNFNIEQLYKISKVLECEMRDFFDFSIISAETSD